MKYSDTGTRTQVAWVKARYPNQLDYIGVWLLRVVVREMPAATIFNIDNECRPSGTSVDRFHVNVSAAATVVSLAERSKAPDSSSGGAIRVGSNPTADIFRFFAIAFVCEPSQHFESARQEHKKRRKLSPERFERPTV